MITVAVIAITCLAFFVQAAFAFGGPLIAVPLLSLLIGTKDAVLITTVFSILSNVLIFKLWPYISWKKVFWVLPSLIGGLLAGLALFSFLNETILLFALTLYIFLYVANDYLKLQPVAALNRVIPTKFQSVFAGLSAGLMQGATGIGGGPPVAVYLKSHCVSVDEYRATYMVIWLVGNILRLLFLGFANFVHQNILLETLITFPFFMAAVFAGYYLPAYLSKEKFGHIVNLLLVISAVSILFKIM